MPVRRLSLPVALLIAAVLPSACKLFKPINPSSPKATAEKPADTKTATKSGPPTATTTAAPKQQSAADMRKDLNDPNIAAMVLALNNTDISYARLAPSRAERPDIKEFANRMLTDHTGVNGLVNDLLTKLNVAPEDNTASLDMRDESANRRDAMRELTGYSFDSTYIENEVAYHKKFLAVIDSVMLPKAKNVELKNLLVAVRPAVAAHLAHSEQVRANVLARR